MAVERRLEILELGHLYKVVQDSSKPQETWMLNPNIYINSGTVNLYGSNTQGKPASIAAMTLNEENTAVGGCLGFGFIPLYLAITQASGTTTEIVFEGADFIDMGVIS